eukprot:5597645-Alexandrium_andersonii.AAC.1
MLRPRRFRVGPAGAGARGRRSRRQRGAFSVPTPRVATVSFSMGGRAPFRAASPRSCQMSARRGT